MNRPSRGRLFAAGGGLVVVCAAAVAVVVHSGHHSGDADRTPPPLGAHPANVQRLQVVASGNPSRPTGYAKASDGGTVGLGVQNDGRKPAAGRAILMIRDGGGTSGPAKVEVVRAGQTVTAYGVEVKVLKIWQMPDPAHNAIDIQVDPAAG
jgi:hypothetical protein